MPWAPRRRSRRRTPNAPAAVPADSRATSHPHDPTRRPAAWDGGGRRRRRDEAAASRPPSAPSGRRCRGARSAPGAGRAATPRWVPPSRGRVRRATWTGAARDRRGRCGGRSRRDHRPGRSGDRSAGLRVGLPPGIGRLDGRQGLCFGCGRRPRRGRSGRGRLIGGRRLRGIGRLVRGIARVAGVAGGGGGGGGGGVAGRGGRAGGCGGGGVAGVARAAGDRRPRVGRSLEGVRRGGRRRVGRRARGVARARVGAGRECRAGRGGRRLAPLRGRPRRAARPLGRDRRRRRGRARGGGGRGALSGAGGSGSRERPRHGAEHHREHRDEHTPSRAVVGPASPLARRALKDRAQQHGHSLRRTSRSMQSPSAPYARRPSVEVRRPIPARVSAGQHEDQRYRALESPDTRRRAKGYATSSRRASARTRSSYDAGASTRRSHDRRRPAAGAPGSRAWPRGSRRRARRLEALGVQAVERDLLRAAAP